MTKTHLNVLETLNLVNLVFPGSILANHMKSVNYVRFRVGLATNYGRGWGFVTK
jgi:hypothetical protein